MRGKPTDGGISLVNVSPLQRKVLLFLDSRGSPAALLALSWGCDDTVKVRTLTGLLERGWVVESSPRVYAITELGKKAAALLRGEGGEDAPSKVGYRPRGSEYRPNEARYDD